MNPVLVEIYSTVAPSMPFIIGAYALMWVAILVYVLIIMFGFKKAEKQMKREKMVGAGKQYAPTLYTVLVNPDDDRRLMGYYPTLAGETETYLAAKAADEGLVMDGQPLVRFIVDEDLKHGKFDIIAEAVAAPIIAQLRAEEMQRYGLAAPSAGGYGAPAQGYAAPRQQAPRQQAPQQQYGGYPQQSLLLAHRLGDVGPGQADPV